jgi:hypothetical protein
MKVKRYLSLVILALALFVPTAHAGPGPRFYSTVGFHPYKPVPGWTITVSPAAATNQFNVGLSWTASASAATCTSANNCSNFGYNVYEGTTSGGEGSTPVNSALVTGTSYSYPVTLTASAQTFYFVVEAVETITSIGTVTSSNSNEASVSFPATPAPPTSLTATP